MTTDRAAFVAVARANPIDRTVRLVFADWLDDRADPLGAYVRAEAEVLAHAPGSPGWRAALLRLRAAPPHGGWEFAADLDRIADKLDRLRALDVNCRVFGARWGDDGHEYVSHPPLPEPGVIDFELRHGCALPGEYRAFVLRVANGRAGPGYGLRVLDCAVHHPELSAPFGPTAADADAIAAAVRAARETSAWTAVPKMRREWYRRGYLPLADQGHGNHAALVLNGPMRGELWGEGTWFVPHRDRVGRPEGFLTWYEHWLDTWLAPGAIERWARATGRA